MRKTFRVHLTSGTTIKFKADNFTIKYNREGEYTEWEAPNMSRWMIFMPSEIVAVERLR